MGFGIEDLKRWHWVVVGLLVGLLLGYAQTEIGGDEYAEAPSTMSPHTFERYLGEMIRGEDVEGHPIIGGVRVYPNGRGYTVTVARLEPVDGTRATARTWKDRVYTWVAPKEGYKPTGFGGVAATGAKADVEVRPGGRWDRGVELSGWESGDGRKWRDPGGGSEVRVALEPGTYRLAVELEPSQHVQAKKSTPPPAALRAAWDAAGVSSDPSGAPPATGATTQPVPRGERLAVTLNGRRLPPLRREPRPGPSLWYADVPADALAAGGAQQVFRFSRGDEAVPVRRIRIYDPDYSVVSFLQDLAKREDRVKFRYAWWAEPRMRLILWTLGGGLIIGGVWPSVLGLLIGAGLARPPRVREKKYDLGRFQSEPEPVKAAAPVGVGLDGDRLEELEEQLLAGLQTDAAVRVEEPRPAVRELDHVPADAATAAEEEDKEYAGEFYPVARPHVHRSGPQDDPPGPAPGL